MLSSFIRTPYLRSGGAGRPRQQRAVPTRPLTTRVRASEGTAEPLEGYVEVKVDSVRVATGTAIVYLRVLDGTGYVIPVHIGEAESNALLREMNHQRQSRPLTHDIAKNMLQAVGYRILKIRVTDCISNTYYARIHLGRAAAPSSTGSPATSGVVDEIDVDARPSDAINLAMRFGAPMYVARKIADAAGAPPIEPYGTAAAAASPPSGTATSTTYSGAFAAAAGGGGIGVGESHAEIVRTVRETLASYDDPTVMYQLQKELAIKEERFEDARAFHDHIVHEMTHNRLLRMVVAMETALADGRYDEAAKLRDEYRRAVSEATALRQKNAAEGWAS